MASFKSKVLKEPIMDDEKTEEIDAEEIQDELDIKGKPITDLKTSQFGEKGSSKSSEAEKTKTPVSNATLNAAGKYANGESKIFQATNDASSALIKQGKAQTATLGEVRGKNSSAKVGLGWVSFEEDGNKRAGADLVTQQTTQGTPLSTVVNGDLTHEAAKITESKTQRAVEKSIQKSSLKEDTKAQEAKSNYFNPSAQGGLINGHVSQNVAGVGGSSPHDVDSGPVSPSWVVFEDSSEAGKAKRLSSTTGSSEVMKEAVSSTPPKPNWVTFEEANKQKKSIREDMSVNVSIPDQVCATPSTPSPNPFANAPIITPKPTSSLFQSPPPLTVVTSTNPFHSENAIQGLTTVDVSPYPSGVPAPTASSEASSTDPSKWVFHDVSVFEKDLKLDQTNNTGPVKADNKPLEVSPVLPATAAEHIEEGIAAAAAAAAAAEVNEEKPAILPESDDESIGEDFTLATTNTSWNMLLRYPDKKKKLTAREWKSVVIKLDGNTLKIFEEYELSAPFREIPLQASFSFDQLRLQPSGRHGKVHTTKLVYLNYKETRSVRQKGTYEHVSEGMPIIKVGSLSHLIIREFMEAIGNSIRTLPAYRDRGITYRKDEVFVDVDDTCFALVSGDGSIKKQGGNVRIKVRAFLTGDPECQLVLNDIVVKEREEARLRGELKPQRVHHWIKLKDCNFHKCANNNSFQESHSIIFHPLDACTFELMQFRVKQYKPLPLLVKAALTIHSERRIELKAEIKLCQDTKMSKYARNNVTFRLPIPETWVPLFRTGGVLGREKSIKSSKGKRAAGIKSRLKHSRCSIAASIGTAQYEPEYSAVVWRIDKLPLIQSKVPVDAPQTLNCLLELPSGMECPENFQPYAELEYDISYVLLSDTTVIAVKVSNRSIPEKWVCYKAFYQYHIDMVVERPNSGPIKDVGCTQQ